MSLWASTAKSPSAKVRVNAVYQAGTILRHMKVRSPSRAYTRKHAMIDCCQKDQLRREPKPHRLCDNWPDGAASTNSRLPAKRARENSSALNRADPGMLEITKKTMKTEDLSLGDGRSP